MKQRRITKLALTTTIAILSFPFDSMIKSEETINSDSKDMGLMLYFHLTTNVVIDFNAVDNHVKNELFAPTLTSCAICCAKDQFCLAFYYSSTPIVQQVDMNSDVGKGSKGTTTPRPQTKTTKASTNQNCRLYGERIKRSNTQPPADPDVSGILGNVKDVHIIPEEDNKSPDFSDAQLLYVTRTNAGLTAVYQCTGGDDKMTSFGWQYDEVKNEWPRFEPDFERCYSTICQQFRGGSGTILSMQGRDKEHATFYRVCSAHEIGVSTFVTCTTKGEWLLEGGPAKVSCVSTECYRVESGPNTAHYRGVLNRSANGQECLPWHLMTTDHSWLEEYDGHDLTNVQNYCRDQDKVTGVSWCWVSDTKQTTKQLCHVPVCVLDPYDGVEGETTRLADTDNKVGGEGTLPMIIG